MTHCEALLIKLSEECSEVSQRCSKALRFGLHETQPSQNLDNAQRITEEMAGLISAYKQLMRDYGVEWPSDQMCDEAAKKAEKYMTYSREIGTLL